MHVRVWRLLAGLVALALVGQAALASPAPQAAGETPVQILLVELVHQKADGAPMHAVNRRAGSHVAMQGLKHQAVAAERDDDVGLAGLDVAVTLGKARQRLLGLGAGTRDEGDPLV